jgi:hypothetical protein
MNVFKKLGAPRCSVSVRVNAGERWSGFCEENAAGMSRVKDRIIVAFFANRV